MLQGGGSTTARDLLERAKQKKAEQDQADDTPQPVCVCQDFFESFLVCLSRFMVVSAMSAQHGGYPACGGKGWERNANVLFFRFYLPPCVAAAKGKGIEKKCKRPVLMFSCSHVLPLRRIPGLLIRFLGRLSLLLRLGIA